jgi:hypothetical protein
LYGIALAIPETRRVAHYVASVYGPGRGNSVKERRRFVGSTIMALIQVLFSWLGKTAGKLLNAIFGWAVVALFGRTSPREQTVLY